MFKPKNFKERVMHRLKITQGHLKKVVGMFEKDEYCIDILHQSQAVQKALKEVDILILENHLKTCAIESIKEGKELTAINEVVEVFRKNRI